MSESNRVEQAIVKCVVWDLDHTVWTGILSEDRDVAVKPWVTDVVAALDERGVLQSIASRNEPEDALQALERFGLTEFFLFPKISWNEKAGSIRQIAAELNIGLDSILFVDDSIFEREAVAYAVPEVRVLDAIDAPAILSHPGIAGLVADDESRQRRQMYRAERLRCVAEEEFSGNLTEFLATLEMRVSIRRATLTDLDRCHELTVRTNQLNTTGKTYSREELNTLIHSGAHEVLVCELQDRFGSYGRVGLALVAIEDDWWTLELLLMSCRVMGKNVGGVLLTDIMHAAKRRHVGFRAAWRDTGRNRAMKVVYTLNGFKISTSNSRDYMTHDLSKLPNYPAYVELQSEWADLLPV